MGFGKRLARGLAAALQSVGHNIESRPYEWTFLPGMKKNMAQQLAWAKALHGKGGAESSLGKLGYDLFGRMPQTSDEWDQVAEFKKKSGWGPQGGVNIEIPGFAELAQLIIGDLTKDYKSNNIGNKKITSSGYSIIPR